MAALALAALACFAPAPARAGHYKITYTASIPANGQANPLIPFDSGPDPFYDYGSNSASGNVTLTVSAVATWTPDGTGDASAPPTSQPFRESLSAFGQEGGTPGQGVTVSDGAGDTPFSHPSIYYSGGVAVQETVTAGADGRHLLVGSGKTITLPPVTMTVNFSGGVSGQVGLCYEVETDSRTVTISCPSIEPSYYKGSVVSGVAQPLQHTRSPDGSMTADSVVQWQSGVDATGASNGLPQGWVVNNLPFTANAANFNNPYYSWNISGPGSFAGPMQGYNTLTVTVNPGQFSLLEPAGSAFPITSIVKINVTDTDGAQGANSYSVTWHLPTENWSLEGVGQNFTTIVQSSAAPATAVYNTSASGQWSYTEETNGSSEALADMFTVGAGLVDPPWSAFVAAAGVVFAKTQSEQAGFTSVNFNQAWTSSYSTWSPAPANSSPATMNTYIMTPELAVVYQPKTYQGDGYGLTGYTGPVSETFDQEVHIEGCGKYIIGGH